MVPIALFIARFPSGHDRRLGKPKCFRPRLSAHPNFPLQWSCNASCPEGFPFEYSESHSGDSVCSVKSESAVANELRRRSIIISCVVLAVILIIILTIIIVCCVLRQRDVVRKEQIRLKVSTAPRFPDCPRIADVRSFAGEVLRSPSR